VFYGGHVGMFESWADVQRSTTGHGLAIHGGYTSLDAATAALEYARSKGWTADSTLPIPNAPLPLPSSYDDNPLNSGSSRNVWYAVARGISPGVYRSYLECSLNISGVKGSLFSSFENWAEAESAYGQAVGQGWVRTLRRTSRV
jgi:viroplasmin and RNaseH domain-containing protein